MNGIALLKCICDETRFEILTVLQDGESSVGGLVSKTGKDQPLVSHHLKTLRKCGIVRSRDEGKRVMYGISSPQLSALIADITDASKRIPVLCDGECC